MKRNPGQIALVALLVMVVLLTVGLAVISRSVTDIRISKETAESARAFSAAEAGIEEALKHDLATLIWTDEPIPVGELEAKVTVTKAATFETKIEKGETRMVNLKKEDETETGWEGNLEVEWAGEGLELTLFYQTGGKWEIKREAFRRLGTACGGLPERPSPTTFTVENSTPGFRKTLRVKALCSLATVKVRSQNPSGNPLPDQAYKIRSSATIPESRQTRVIEVTKSLPILPPTFDYVLFSGGGLIK